MVKLVLLCGKKQFSKQTEMPILPLETNVVLPDKDTIDYIAFPITKYIYDFPSNTVEAILEISDENPDDSIGDDYTKKTWRQWFTELGFVEDDC